MTFTMPGEAETTALADLPNWKWLLFRDSSSQFQNDSDDHFVMLRARAIVFLFQMAWVRSGLKVKLLFAQAE